MHYCDTETEPGSSAFSLGTYNSRRALMSTRTYTVTGFNWLNKKQMTLYKYFVQQVC
jgi:hypothetical protein